MGGAGYIFTGDHDADVMHNSVTINLNVLESQKEMNDKFGKNRTKIFSSSACAYPEFNQLDPDNPIVVKIQHTLHNLIVNMDGKNSSVSGCISLIIGIMAFLLGLLATTTSLDQKEPGMEEVKKHQQQSAERSASLPEEGGAIEVWGDGLQTRSFLFVDECIEATRRLMDSDFMGPVNIGSEEMVTINELLTLLLRCW